jgi:hypothetical protein
MGGQQYPAAVNANPMNGYEHCVPAASIQRVWELVHLFSHGRRARWIGVQSWASW